MPLYFFYIMVQKSQKWPKTQIKGGPALSFNESEQTKTVFAEWRRRWADLQNFASDFLVFAPGLRYDLSKFSDNSVYLVFRLRKTILNQVPRKN